MTHDFNDLAHELWAMAQGPQPVEDAVRAIAARLTTTQGDAPPTAVAPMLKAGWDACLRMVFSLTDQAQDETADKSDAFERGRRFEAKSIARAMSAIGPEHCDDLRAALTSAPEEQKVVEIRSAVALQAAHRLGFLRAAGWMQCDYLFEDVEGETYRKDRDRDIRPMIEAAPAETPPAAGAIDAREQEGDLLQFAPKFSGVSSPEPTLERVIWRYYLSQINDEQEARNYAATYIEALRTAIASRSEAPAVGAIDAREQEVDLIARGMSWADTMTHMKEACAQSGVPWNEDTQPKSLVINVMQRVANAAHKTGFLLGLERAALASRSEAPAAAGATQAAIGAALAPMDRSTWTEDHVRTYPRKAAAIINAALATPAEIPPAAAPAQAVEANQPKLVVKLRSFPESNGKRNWTAMICREAPWHGLAGNCGGITVEQGEYWNRVAYYAERTCFLLGQRDTEPNIRDYGDDIQTPDEWKGEIRAAPASTPPAVAAPAQTVEVSDVIEWLGNHYQEYPNIASLCEAMRVALQASKPEGGGQ